MKRLDLSKVQFSRNDIKWGIKVPEFLTEELAYFLGFHVGDGCMLIQKRPHAIEYRLEYNGHQINEWAFYENVLNQLIKKLFNKQTTVRKGHKTVMISFRSKRILFFLKNCCGIPLSPKKEIIVPKIIQNSNKKIKSLFLRGLADTDFSLAFKKGGKYPVINHATYSRTLHESIKTLLAELGFTYYSGIFNTKRKETKLVTHTIDINGKKKLKRWMELIGFSSYNSISRYLVWKETGSLPVGTDINDRIKILEKRGIKFPISASGEIRTLDSAVNSFTVENNKFTKRVL